jgi:hypothetical protein
VKLEFEIVEDAFDDTTHIRTMTEQAPIAGKGWLIRTTIYTPHHISAAVTFVPGSGAPDALFSPLSP